MHFVVLGCEPIGVSLALDLERDGHSVAVIAGDNAAFGRLGPAFRGQRIMGEGYDREVLKQAGIERAAGFAAVTLDDKLNALAAYVARTAFKVDHVVARMADLRQQSTYDRLGVPTFAPSVWGAQRARELLTDFQQQTALRLGDGEVEVIPLVVPAEAAGQTAGGLAVPGETALVALVRGGHAQVPTAGTVLESGDIVYLSVASAARGRLADLLQ